MKKSNPDIVWVTPLAYCGGTPGSPSRWLRSYTSTPVEIGRVVEEERNIRVGLGTPLRLHIPRGACHCGFWIPCRPAQRWEINEAVAAAPDKLAKYAKYRAHPGTVR